MNRLLPSFVLALAGLAATPLCPAAVLAFDDIAGAGPVGANYGGLDWSHGDWFAFSGEQPPFTAHSGRVRVASGFGDADAAPAIGLGQGNTLRTCIPTRRDRRRQVSPTRAPRQQALCEKGIRTRDLDLLKANAIAGTLPQVAWICATSSGSGHPSASSPAQGAAYIAKALDALTANPDVWSKTVLIVNFDENDGLFDHMAPPPSYVAWNADPAQATLAGASTLDAADEYLGDADGGIADSTSDPALHGAAVGSRYEV